MGQLYVRTMPRLHIVLLLLWNLRGVSVDLPTERMHYVASTMFGLKN